MAGGFIDKIYKLTKSVDHITNIADKFDVNSLLGGLNLNNLDMNSLGSVGSSIESSINSKVTELTSGFDNLINIGDIESIASGITPADVGMDLGNMDLGLGDMNLGNLGMDVGSIDLGDLSSLGIDLNGINFM